MSGLNTMLCPWPHCPPTDETVGTQDTRESKKIILVKHLTVVLLGDVEARQSTGDVASQAETGVHDILLHKLKGGGALPQCLELQVLLLHHQGTMIKGHAAGDGGHAPREHICSDVVLHPLDMLNVGGEFGDV